MPSATSYPRPVRGPRRASSPVHVMKPPWASREPGGASQTSEALQGASHGLPPGSACCQGPANSSRGRQEASGTRKHDYKSHGTQNDPERPLHSQASGRDRKNEGAALRGASHNAGGPGEFICDIGGMPALAAGW